MKVMFMGADRVWKIRVQTLKAEFEALNVKEPEDVDEFTVKVSYIMSTMCALGDTVEESYVVKKLLRTVASKFLLIASTFEHFGDLNVMTFKEVVGRLKAQEECMKGHVENEERKLLLTHQEWTDRNKKKNDDDSKKLHKENYGRCSGSRGRGRVKCNVTITQRTPVVVVVLTNRKVVNHPKVEIRVKCNVTIIKTSVIMLQNVETQDVKEIRT